MEFVKNPHTNRPIRVGGLSWKKLVRDGVLADDTDLISKEEIETDKEIEKLNKELPFDKQAVRGRGKYSGSIVERNKQLDVKDVLKKVSNVASKIVKEHILVDSDEDVEMLFAELIMKELVGKAPVLTKRDATLGRKKPALNTLSKAKKFKLEKVISSDDDGEAYDDEYFSQNEDDSSKNEDE